jgi:acyl carrier protein
MTRFTDDDPAASSLLDDAPASPGPPASGPLSEPAIRAWLVEHLASLLDIPENEVDVTQTFEEFGLDSAAAVAMTGELAAWANLDLDPNLASHHPTIESVTLYVAERLRSGS